MAYISGWHQAETKMMMMKPKVDEIRNILKATATGLVTSDFINLNALLAFSRK